MDTASSESLERRLARVAHVFLSEHMLADGWTPGAAFMTGDRSRQRRAQADKARGSGTRN